MKYNATFIGREVGAIGISYNITATVEGANEEAARLALYDRYEHILGLQLKAVETVKIDPAKLNRRERQALQELRHYDSLERLAERCGVEAPDGRQIAAALARLESKASRAATAQCNGEPYLGQPFREEDEWTAFKEQITCKVAALFNSAPPPGFFINSDPRGYALKIDNEDPAGKALIDAVKLHTDWGGYGILSPEITGN